MARRPSQTLIDYLVIAVSPALIMTMTGSLVFFLLSVFYRGEYSGRLHYVMALFVFAAVLIGRIAIELGKERAMLYMLPLAMALMLVINRFVPDSAGLTLAMIAVIWFFAHKLTFDCTLIDESQDSSGEGLLQTAGLAGRENAKPRSQEAVQPRRRHAAEPAEESAPQSSDENPEGVTSRDATRPGWMQRLIDPPPKAHAPGTWLIYFGLAALPLFGFLRQFLPANERTNAFGLFLIYAASALALLLTTSFLGLRRYLRQRKIAMPSSMAALWLAAGCGLIVGCLFLAIILPRPSPEYAFSESPFTIRSPEQNASKIAFGRESAERNPNDAPAGEEKKGRQPPDEQRARSGDAKKGPKRSTAADGEKGAAEQRGRDRGKQSGDGPKTPSQNAGKKQQGADSQKSSQHADRKSQQSSSGPKQDAARQDRESSEQTSSDPSQEDSQDGSDESRSAEKQPSDETQSTDSKSGERRDASSKSSSSSPMQKLRSALPNFQFNWSFASVGTLLKWIFYGVVAVVVAVLLFRNAARLPAMLRQLIALLSELWAGLFGGRRREAAEGEETAAKRARMPAPRRWSDYVDPFASGEAARLSPEALVRYSFEALEAWGRDHGCLREPDQTAHEYAKAVGETAGEVAEDARRLADLYSRLAYADGSLTPANVRPLAQLWRRLYEADRAAPVAPATPDKLEP